MRELRIAKLNFCRWKHDPKYMVVVLYLFLYSFERTCEIPLFAQDLGVKICPWLFPFLPCLGSGFLPFMLGFALLISDAPFRTRQQGLVMQRTGKRPWLLGQLLYLFIVCIGFTVFMWVLSWLWLIPDLTWSGEWGDFFYTVAMRNVIFEYNVPLEFPYAVVKNTNPVMITLWCAAAMASVCFMFGVIMVACNLWLKKGCGTAIIAILSAISLIPDMSAFTPGPIRYILWFSPINWMDYSLMGNTGEFLPSHAFSIICPLLLALGLSAILLLTIGKCNIETDKE